MTLKTVRIRFRLRNGHTYEEDVVATCSMDAIAILKVRYDNDISVVSYTDVHPAERRT